jgi:hypothetical protein
VFDPEVQMTKLASVHPNATNPHHPYSGVTLVFNGDWHIGCPKDSDRIRAAWDVVSPFELEYTGPTAKEILAAEELIEENPEEM